VALGRGAISVDEVLAARAAGKRTSLWVTLPAKGLTLVSVTYPEDGQLAMRAEQTRAKRKRSAD